MSKPSELSTTEKNRATFRAFLNLVNQGKFDDLDELVHPDYCGHIPFPSPAPGFVGEKMIYKANALSIPDIHLTADVMIAEGDYVAGMGGVTGTHSGTNLFGAAAKGTQLHWDAIDVARFQDGLIIERWLEADAVSLMQQLGLMPQAPATGESPIPPRHAGLDSTPAQNKAAVERFIEEVWNRGHLDVVDEIFHPEATSPSAPQLPRGGEGVRVIVQMFRSAFPDYHISIDFQVAEGNWVCARFTQSGTQQAELMGIAATGKHAQWTELGFLRFEGGMVVESWYQLNMLSLMAQLGVTPT